MTEQECLDRMVAPGTRRPGKYREGVIQIHVTRSCDKACFNCTQGSNLGGKTTFMNPVDFEHAVMSLKGYFGVVGLFGGNPALSPHFPEYCEILKRHVPKEQRGIWCNNPLTLDRAKLMRDTFDPSVSNLNVHLNKQAFELFKMGWPECSPVGLYQDSRHSPPFVAMKDVLRKTCPGCDGEGSLMYYMTATRCKELGGWLVIHDDGVYQHYTPDGKEMEYKTIGGDCPVCHGVKTVYDSDRGHELISNCDINQHWSAMIGLFRGQLRAWFCEIAGAQSMLHQDEEDYPDTGVPILESYPNGKDQPCEYGLMMVPIRSKVEGQRPDLKLLRWWEFPMNPFIMQVRKHCHDCGVPLKGHGELSQQDDDKGKEQVSTTHAAIYRTKRKGRQVELVHELVQLGTPLGRMTNYLGNARL